MVEFLVDEGTVGESGSWMDGNCDDIETQTEKTDEN